MWQTIKDHPAYEISDYGVVRHKAHYAQNEHIMRPNSVNGYLYVTLDAKVYRLHRLVAEHFVPNPNGLPQVNHKDGDKWNNTTVNLEWVTAQDNVRHAIEQGLFGNTSFNRIPVRCVETGVVYPSSKDAGIACNSPDGACVSRCVKGKQRTAHGFHWERATTRS